MVDVNNDPFYPTRWTEQDKNAIRNSPIWPLLVGAHYAFNNKLYISYSRKDYGFVSMGLLNGVQILFFSINQEKDYVVKECTDGVRVVTSSEKKPLIQSGNPQYILKKFNDPNEPCNEQVKRRIADGEARTLQNILLEGAGTLRGNRPPRPSLSMTEDNFIFALESMYGAISVDVNDKNRTNELMTLYQSHVSYLNKRTKYEKLVRSFFDRDKWIIISANDKCRIIGYMNTSVLGDSILGVNAMRFILDSSTMPVPFNLYNSHEHTPFREEIMGALTMCKVAREGKDKPIIRCSDPEGLFPIDSMYDPHTGMLVWISNNQSKCYMFDKLI